MLEVFLFVNPIGMRCRDAEAAVTRLATESRTRVELHFVMLLNFEIIDHFMRAHELDCYDLPLRNQLFDAAYQLALDYKAAQFQGNQKARTLLMAEQEMFMDGTLRYDPAFAAACVRGYGLNWERFVADRAAEATQNCFATDQEIALEMGVTAVPNAVIFTHDLNASGIKVGNLGSYQRLAALCDHLVNNPPQVTPLLRTL